MAKSTQPDSTEMPRGFQLSFSLFSLSLQINHRESVSEDFPILLKDFDFQLEFSRFFFIVIFHFNHILDRNEGKENIYLLTQEKRGVEPAENSHACC